MALTLVLLPGCAADSQEQSSNRVEDVAQNVPEPEEADPEQQLRDSLTGTWRAEDGTLLGFYEECSYLKDTLPSPYLLEPCSQELIVGDRKIPMQHKIGVEGMTVDFISELTEGNLELVSELGATGEGSAQSYERVSDSVSFDDFSLPLDADSSAAQSLGATEEGLEIQFWDGEVVTDPNQVVRVTDIDGNQVSNAGGETVPREGLERNGDYVAKRFALLPPNPTYMEVKMVSMVDGVIAEYRYDEEDENEVTRLGDYIFIEQHGDYGVILYPQSASGIDCFIQVTEPVTLTTGKEAPTWPVYHFVL